ncbi:MAG: hypothetical protein CFH01_01794 [Alphaproteobacteria bacterium MarineAlpha2_Bin1]|nr:MAG: hypothetical protein CFH01_01794 [Alphaproteobacteria bacterium MarineAlpha2_Bin1]
MSEKNVNISNTPSFISIIMLLLLGFSFALVLVFNRVATENGIPFIPLVFWQSFGAAIILSFISFIYGVSPLNISNLRVYVVTGLLNLTIPYLIFTFVAPKVPSSILSIGLSLIPVTTYGLALITRLDTFRLLRIFGILIGLFGVLFIILPEASLPSSDMTPWVILGFLAPLSYALNTICVAMLTPPNGNSVQFAAGLTIVGAVSMMIVMVITDQWWIFTDNFKTKGEISLLCAMANNALAFYLIFELIKRAGPVYFSMVNYLATLVGIGIGFIYFNDTLSVWVWVSLILISLSLILVNIITPDKN